MHIIAKPLPWAGGAPVIEDVIEDAQPLKRVDAKARSRPQNGQILFWCKNIEKIRGHKNGKTNQCGVKPGHL